VSVLEMKKFSTNLHQFDTPSRSHPHSGSLVARPHGVGPIKVMRNTKAGWRNDALRE
jgi:hypothetical protein